MRPASAGLLLSGLLCAVPTGAQDMGLFPARADVGA